ncbi:hypothetical protein Ahy_A03g015224 isoform B [Arachis hypogaea]|uniref:Uncharacterized protein n=1 Tax=Arachis hypogaea TaxID=3818 RepID=A0A445DZX5_ARAHY|nr:hypothetical protein Ahy_A03g015224 isoform B [Arachis hypogaea]
MEECHLFRPKKLHCQLGRS